MKDYVDFLILADGGGACAKTLLEKLSLNKSLIILDGACEILDKKSIVPDVIIGDMDSASSETLKFFQKLGTKIVGAYDQNFSDLEKGIMYCKNNFAKSITIANACHGRLDHFIANIFFLKKYYDKHCEMKIADGTSFIIYVKDNKIKIESKIGAKCGLFGAPECIASTIGLKYELSNVPLTLGHFESLANEFLRNEVTCDISGECLITYELP